MTPKWVYLHLTLRSTFFTLSASFTTVFFLFPGVQLTCAESDKSLCVLLFLRHTERWPASSTSSHRHFPFPSPCSPGESLKVTFIAWIFTEYPLLLTKFTFYCHNIHFYGLNVYFYGLNIHFFPLLFTFMAWTFTSTA